MRPRPRRKSPSLQAGLGATLRAMLRAPGLLSLAFLLGAACGGNPATAPATTASPPGIAGPAMPAQAPYAASTTTARAPKAPVPLEEYFKIRRISSRAGVLLSFSHDEKLVAYLSDEGGRTDVWVQAVAGGPATQVTHVKGFVTSLGFSPTADLLVYGSDVGGDELPHLLLTDSKGSAPRDITADLPAGRRADLLEWADDGKSFLFLSSARDERYLDVCEYDVASGRITRLWEASGKLSLSGHSRDHRRFIITEQLSDADNNLYLVERATPTRQKLLTPHQGSVRFTPSDFSRDAKTLYYVTDEKREFFGLHALDLASGKSTMVAQPEGDVEGGGFSHTWKYVLFTVNADGQDQVELRDARTQKAQPLPAPPPGGAWVPLTWS